MVCAAASVDSVIRSSSSFAGLQLTFCTVLKLLSQERGVYGLRNGDNERYRRHCSNKLHRLRQVTGTTSGKGKVYKKPAPIAEGNVKDVKSVLPSVRTVLHKLTYVLDTCKSSCTLRKERWHILMP